MGQHQSLVWQYSPGTYVVKHTLLAVELPAARREEAVQQADK